MCKPSRKRKLEISSCSFNGQLKWFSVPSKITTSVTCVRCCTKFINSMGPAIEEAFCGASSIQLPGFSVLMQAGMCDKHALCFLPWICNNSVRMQILNVMHTCGHRNSTALIIYLTSFRCRSGGWVSKNKLCILPTGPQEFRGCQSHPLSLIMWASSMMNLPSLYFWLLSKACS